jgi:hypothetical protein
MRSGTSLVAQIVHRLGFQVAPFIPAPMPPSWRSDWEDPRITIDLILGEKIDWHEYMRGRAHLSKATGFLGRYAIKSPYLALRYGAISEAAPEAFWIRCERQEEAVDRSFKAHPQLDDVAQYRIDKALHTFDPHMIVRYEYVLEEPLMAVEQMANTLGVHDVEPIQAAANLVGQPTEYTCPQSKIRKCHYARNAARAARKGG